MTTATLSRIRANTFSKLFWLRTNRVLAWTMVVSPALQWAGGMRFWTGFWIDMAILLAHAVLSFALFGKPENKSRAFSFGMHVMGFRSPEMSARNRFLLTGYRIALAAAAMLVLTFTDNPHLIIAFTILFIYPMLRLGVSVIQHLYLASYAAMRRWKLDDMNAGGLAVSLVIVYLMVSVINMMRG